MQRQNTHMDEPINEDVPAHTTFIFPSAYVSEAMNNW